MKNKRSTQDSTFKPPKACITCKLENICKQKHPFPLDLCECCEKYNKI